MNQKRRDVTVSPETITVGGDPHPGRESKTGMVDPLDLLVTRPVLSRASMLTKDVSNTRRSEYTINILKEFLDLPIDTELSILTKPAEVIVWLAERADSRGEDATDTYGKDIYQNLRNLTKGGYLREPDEEMMYDLPALQTTAKGVAYLVWHGELETDDLLRMLVTATVKPIGFIPADVSDTYETPYEINVDQGYLSAELLTGTLNTEPHAHHLRGSDGTQIVRNLAAGVFDKDHKKVWNNLGTAQIEFVRYWTLHHVRPAPAAEAYLADHIMKSINQVGKLIPLLAELNPDDPNAKDVIKEEICRVGWELLKAAGDEAVGLNEARNKDSHDMRSDLLGVHKAAEVITAMVNSTGIQKLNTDRKGNKTRSDLVIDLDDDNQLFVELKNGKRRPLSTAEENNLYQKVIRATKDLPSSRIIDMLDDEDKWELYEEMQEQEAGDRYIEQQMDIARGK